MSLYACFPHFLADTRDYLSIYLISYSIEYILILIGSYVKNFEVKYISFQS